MKEKGARELLAYDQQKKQAREIETHIQQVQQAKEEIKTDLDKQKERMMQRLAQRRQKIANSRSMSLTMGKPMFRGGKD